MEPSANPDGQIMVTDWYNKYLGTAYEGGNPPFLYHPYVGHDDNRDLFLFSQKESQMTAQVLWHDWFPSIWLDEHQQGNAGPRIFTMPATDPINPNVHPLIYRLNTIYGQAQAAALEAEGKNGIIYNATYTNFWQGAMAWSGWWHNEVGLLTEVASVRIATPVMQRMADPSNTAASVPTGGRPTNPNSGDRRSVRMSRCRRRATSLPRTEYPRPWLGGTWKLRDIVDYEMIATIALLDAAADRREALLHEIYDVNATTIDLGKKGELGFGNKDKSFAILIPVKGQHDSQRSVGTGGEAAARRRGSVRVPRKLSCRTARLMRPARYVIPFNQVFRALCQGSARKADLSGSSPRPECAGRSALRCVGVVARDAVRRQDGVRENGAGGGSGAGTSEERAKVHRGRGKERREGSQLVDVFLTPARKAL